MILWSIFVKVFEGQQSAFYGLYFIKNDQRLAFPGDDAGGQLNETQDTVDVKVGFKQIGQLSDFLKIDIGHRFVFIAPKCFHEPRFANLSCPFD